jgi:hypothetical protein
VFLLWNDVFIYMETTKKKYQRPQTEVVCGDSQCGKSFMKDVSEVKRNQKRGSKNYCSLSCSGKDKHEQLLIYCGNPQNFKGVVRSDKYTGIRDHLRRAKNRNHEVTITLDDLLEQWILQDGICVYTGVKLIHPIRAKDEGFLFTASLDRVDSSIGYVPGNIQFISTTANLAKNKLTHHEMLKFCELVSENWMNKQKTPLS